MQKPWLIFLFIFVVLSPFYAEAETEGEDAQNKTEKIENSTIKQEPLPRAYGFYLGAKFALNKVDEEEKFQPFAISAMLGFEYEGRISRHFGIEPSLDISIWHYLLSGEIAAYSEPENRTAFAIAFALELPFMVIFDIKRFYISFGASLATFMRGSVLDLGIKANEGAEVGLSAKEEVKKINQYHWQSGRWFYPAIRLKGGYTFETGWKASLIFTSYIPIFNAWNKTPANTKKGKISFLHDAIFSLAISIHPPKKEHTSLKK